VLNNPDPEALAEIVRLLPGIQILESSELELLGAPLTAEVLPTALEAKIVEVRRLALRLPLLKSHASLFLLKNCISIPKMVYLHRCVPSWKAPTQLDSFDVVMREALSPGVNYERLQG